MRLARGLPRHSSRPDDLAQSPRLRPSRRRRSMEITGPAKMLKIYIGESDKWHGKPLSTELVQRLRSEGMAGATVLRAVEGFGANSRVHTAHILRLSEDLPLVVEVIDRPDRIEHILPTI